MSTALTEAISPIVSRPTADTLVSHILNINRSSARITSQIRFTQMAWDQRDEADREPVVALENTGPPVTSAVVAVVNFFYQGSQIAFGLLPSNKTSRTANNNNRNATVTHLTLYRVYLDSI